MPTDSSPMPVDGLSTEDRLFQAMDRAALNLIAILEDETVINVGTLENPEVVPRYDLSTKMKCFEMGQNWLIRRQKLRPKDPDEDGALVQDMRQWMESKPEEVRKLFSGIGVVVQPEKKVGRPTREQAAIRARYDAHRRAEREAADGEDDSGWQKMLGQPTGSEP